MAFLDIAKAYDSVSRSILWRYLVKVNVPPNLIHAILSIYAEVRFIVKGDTADFVVGAGVRQGCPLSCLLYILFVNSFEDFLIERGCNGVRVRVDDELELASPYFNSCMYADDRTVFCENERDFQKTLDACCEFSESIQSDFNSKKTKVMISLPSRHSSSSFHLGGETLETVKSFRYLGVDISANGDVSAYKRSRLASARQKAAVLISAVRLGRLTIRAASYAWRCYIVPSLLWGAAVWGFEKWEEA